MSLAAASYLGPVVPARRGLAPGGAAWVLLLLLAGGVVPFVANDYWFSAVLLPFLVFSLAGLGLNLLTGYAGQLSVGSAAFMAIGAFATYNFALRLPGLPLPLCFALGGGVAALFGLLVGLPSLRIKGFYLIVSSLAAQFFVQWVLVRFGWFSDYNASGVISAPRLVVAGLDFSTPAGRYLFTLCIVAVLTVLAHNLVHSATGRHWMAVRDTDTAAAVIGIPTAAAKLLAFGISSFYLGIAGALWAFAYIGTVEPHGFDLTRSFQVLFIVIIGGLGSIAGSFLGAAFIVLFPVLLSVAASRWLDGVIAPGNLENAQKIVFGALIIVFLIKEPEGLARLLRRRWQRCRAWPLQA
ncbi:branched-chain amino acid ABC transporter permease [Aquabacterium sp. A7-Y]|uniref:branched-chain amino acid ABC transporter permease n=1 Tax=Aquabacterium sp. A7-Y TaxID=1349605 RepID=UPI00223DC6E4|nr:branched-chain amino acid ABC transporter permease [Aquabacterium sp. A7-Y]MCW7540162.1 branched-chain amino acid ABC transporter permease [Aquabacterium sp. A7-Y]